MSPLLGLIPGVGGHMEILLIAGVALLLFGHRLPSVMRSLGTGIVEFKKGMSGDGSDEDAEGKKVESKPQA